MIEIAKNIFIPDDQLVFRFSRSAGPGGQNVNKVNTAVTLYFDLAGSNAFTDLQKSVIGKKFPHRINKDGQMWVTCQQYRTQKANRQTALQRLTELLNLALTPKKPRKKTKIPYSAKTKRLEEKKHHAQLKKLRSPNFPKD